MRILVIEDNHRLNSSLAASLAHEVRLPLLNRAEDKSMTKHDGNIHAPAILIEYTEDTNSSNEFAEQT